MSVTLEKSEKHLSKMRLLEIIGLSNIPLSTRQVEKDWKRKNSYVYEMIKNLYKPKYKGRTHPDRYLNVTYKDTAKDKIRNIEASEKDQWIRPIKIADITNNPENWRYFLNLRGFLEYLKLVDENDKVDTRKINSIINNLTNYQEFNFLNYFAIFGNADKVNLLVQIARELKFNLNTYSREYLRYYIIKRCQEEISIWLAIEDNTLLKKFSRFMKNKDIENTDELIKELSNYKIKILYELIPIEQNNLEFTMKDLNRTKQRISEL